MRVLLWCGFVLILLTGDVCWAKGTVNRQMARKYHELGMQLYETRRHTEALVEFRKAYKFAPLPGILFNIARCHEALGDHAAALENFERYLAAEPDSARKTYVEQRITALNQQLEQAKSRSNDKPKPPAPEPKPAPLPEPLLAPPTEETGGVEADESPTAWRATAGWTAVGVGAASLVAGVVFSALASSKTGEWNDGFKEGLSYEELEQIQASGEAYQKAQISTLVIGGVLAAGGAALLLWERLGNNAEEGDQAETPSVSLLPYLSGHGAGIAGQARF